MIRLAGQPIETAPRDGSEFLAYDPVARKFDVCMWRNEPSGMIGAHPTQIDSEWGPCADEFQSERATLWWPLPAVE